MRRLLELIRDMFPYPSIGRVDGYWNVKGKSRTSVYMQEWEKRINETRNS
jgi:hypothetical protein